MAKIVFNGKEYGALYANDELRIYRINTTDTNGVVITPFVESWPVNLLVNNAAVSCGIKIGNNAYKTIKGTDGATSPQYSSSVNHDENVEFSIYIPTSQSIYNTHFPVICKSNSQSKIGEVLRHGQLEGAAMNIFTDSILGPTYYTCTALPRIKDPVIVADTEIDERGNIQPFVKIINNNSFPVQISNGSIEFYVQGRVYSTLNLVGDDIIAANSSRIFNPASVATVQNAEDLGVVSSGVVLCNNAYSEIMNIYSNEVDLDWGSTEESSSSSSSSSSVSE